MIEVSTKFTHQSDVGGSMIQELQCITVERLLVRISKYLGQSSSHDSTYGEN